MNKIEKLLTANTGLSSKRTIAIVGLILLVIVVIAALMGTILPEYYIITIAALVGVNQGLTLFQQPRYNNGYQNYTEYDDGLAPPPEEDKLGRADNP